MAMKGSFNSPLCGLNNALAALPPSPGRAASAWDWVRSVPCLVAPTAKNGSVSL